MASVNSPSPSTRIRLTRERSKVASSSGERKYIDHLEGELSAVQTELSAATSPSVSREYSSKMNRINAENRQLQAQLKDWEVRYDEEIRDFVQKHNAVERSLRNTNSHLEQYATKAKDRVAELEEQLRKAEEALEAADAANIQLEKRIEIMSELLAASPTKIDFHGERSERKRRPTRPKSMFPRFPRPGSWVGSPERGSDSGRPYSPSLATASERGNSPEPMEQISLLDTMVDEHNESTENASVLDESSTTMSNKGETDHALIRDFRYPDLAPPYYSPIAKSRPTRRMRRFGAGSTVLKPLILPSTSHCDSNPTSAPPLDRHEAIPSFPLEQFMHDKERGISPPRRARATTMADESMLTRLQASPELEEPKEPGEAEANFRRMLSIARLSSGRRSIGSSSLASHRGGVVSRNLLEELNEAKIREREKRTVRLEFENYDAKDSVLMHDTANVFDGIECVGGAAIDQVMPQRLSPANQTDIDISRDEVSLEDMLLQGQMDRAFPPPFCYSSNPDVQGNSADSDLTPRALQTRRDSSVESAHASNGKLNLSTLDRLFATFSDLFRSPLEFARFVIHTTQHQMHLPTPLIPIQWWLIGLLWGPMAKRRMLDVQRKQATDNHEEHGLVEVSCAGVPSLTTNESLAYGTIYHSPLASGLRKRIGMAGPGRKRTGNLRKGSQDGQSILMKHNPVLWVKLSVTLAFAIGAAFKSGPGSLMEGSRCSCTACRVFER